jgi:transposase
VNSLSLDLRRRIVAAYERDEGTYFELAQRFGVGEATVSRLLRRQRELGHVVPEVAGGGFPPRISDE